MKFKAVTIPFIVLVLFLMLTLVTGCAKKEKEEATPSLKGELTVLHAGSLAVPFKQVEKEFERKYPEVKVEREARGSRATIRQVTALHREADVVASSDYSIILPMMSPKYAAWYIAFARNQMVLAYTEKSAYSKEINKENWYKILVNDPKNKGVTYGHGNPDIDPCGYRALMVWKLAEKHYDVSGLYNSLLVGNGRESKGREVVRPKETDLIALLEAGELDYAFEYLSIAKQHRLKYIKLPKEIDLSSKEFKDFYATAKVKVSGKKPGEQTTISGKPIIYGITIPENAPHPNLATAWIKFLLGSEGQEIMKRNGQPPISPGFTNDRSKLPNELKPLAVETKTLGNHILKEPP